MVDGWLRGHNAPPINSGHQIQGHGRRVVPPAPEICPQCSLTGLFTTGHPEGDKESGVTGPPTGPAFTAPSTGISTVGGGHSRAHFDLRFTSLISSFVLPRRGRLPSLG